MIHESVNAMHNTVDSSKRWMIIAFISGMVFTAVLIQTLMTMNMKSPDINFQPASENDDSPGQAPGNNLLDVYDCYRLVYDYPEIMERIYKV